MDSPIMPLPRFQHCFHHAGREAVVRCPICERFYCRECVTEHDQRMLCSGCLAELKGSGGVNAGRFRRRLAVTLQGVMGFILLWSAFYLIGRILLAIPDDFHEGTFWERSFRDPL